MNWKRGITRIYIVLSIVWFVAVSSMAFLHDEFYPAQALGVAAVWGILLPALIFVAARWIGRGFSKSKDTEDKQ